MVPIKKEDWGGGEEGAEEGGSNETGLLALVCSRNS